MVFRRTLQAVVLIAFIKRLTVVEGCGSFPNISNDIYEANDGLLATDSRNYVERMVEKWAPLVWLAPGEKFFPSRVPEFLQYVTIRSTNEEFSQIPAGTKSEKMYLVTKTQIDSIDDNLFFSFLPYHIEAPEFLQYVTIRSTNEEFSQIPAGTKSEKMYLVTKTQIEDLLQNSTSILYGQNPNFTNVPVYAHVSECGCNHFHVTYWFFFPFSQGKTMCILDMGMLGPWPIPHFNNRCFGTLKEFGSHVGDWEHASFLFKGNEEPEEMYVSTHDAGAFYKYDLNQNVFVFDRQEIRKGFIQRPTFPPIVKLFKDNNGYHPILFAAKGSHGLWTAPGKHKYVRLPRLYDISGYGIPWNTWKQIEFLYSDKDMPEWMFFLGKWGNPRSKCHPLSRMGLNICEITDGPSGIPKKKRNFSCGVRTKRLKKRNP